MLATPFLRPTHLRVGKRTHTTSRYDLAHGGAEPFMRTVGGDELNVCVDLAVLNKGAMAHNAAPQARRKHSFAQLGIGWPSNGNTLTCPET